MSDTSRYPVPGRRYRHYKGCLYYVGRVCLIEDGKIPAVAYHREDCEGPVWVRPITSWLEDVTLPDGTAVPRFAPVD